MTRYDAKHRANLQAGRRAAAEQASRDRSDDLAWMARWAETPREAARRLGISRDSLYTWCHNNDPDVWARLVLNEQRRKVAS